MSQTLPMTIDEYSFLTTFESGHERLAMSLVNGHLYKYNDTVKWEHKKSENKKYIFFHNSIKTFSVYNEFWESCILDLSRPIDVILTYPKTYSLHKCFPYISMKFFWSHKENKKYLQFVLFEFLSDASKNQYSSSG